jgi:hypothetical protein
LHPDSEHAYACTPYVHALACDASRYGAYMRWIAKRHASSIARSVHSVEIVNATWCIATRGKSLRRSNGVYTRSDTAALTHVLAHDSRVAL